MKIKEITNLNDPSDLVYDCLDVFVTLEDDYCTDGYSYLIELTTPEFLSDLMKRSENNFVKPGYPYIIVSKLTDDIIRTAIQAYIDEDDDSFWLKLYHITPTLTIKDINEILYRKKQENIELEAEVESELDAEIDD